MKSVSAYGEFEQLKGGVETLFGAKGAQNVDEYAKYVGKSVSSVKGEYEKLKGVEATVIKNANNAYKTAGLSANDYMETVTSFSASLIQSLNGDTEKAAALADVAITDMSDNANKMGTDMGSIQYAYQGFAKQNYTMLDNLKLGYGGTKSEMERLIKDAAKLDKSVKSNDMSYANIVKAIHAVQENMGIMGTTAKEANFTIQGSISSMKAAWGNLMPALIKGGDEFDQCVDNLIESIVGVKDESGKMVGGVLNNIMPALEKALGGIGQLIDKLAPIIEENLPMLIEKLLPPLIKAATSLLVGLDKALPSIIKVLVKEIPNIIKSLGEAIAEAIGGQSFLKPITKAVGVAGGAILATLVALKGFKAYKAISSIFTNIGGGTKGIMQGVNPLSSLAGTNTKTVLKGMANLAIIIGGLTLLAAALMAVAPYIAQLSDFKTIIKVVGIIGILGALGTVLSVFAGIVGKIPVMTVVKGLANMAIMLGGLGALAAVFIWLSPKIAELGDIKSLLKVAAIMVILGVVGTALSVFAGISGMIPIPLVLAGLANMALVLGGLTAFIAAFGALGQIPGFNEFIDTGGTVLANLFGQLGKIVGSIIGGIGEGLTNSLPAIGDNLSAFAKSISPMLATFSSTDVSGVGAFLTALGKFIFLMAGEKVLSFITGKTNYAELGTQLSAFGESATGFFTKVATYPENGFTNATRLFDCLAGMKSLPKEGGIVGWFSGKINYGNIASGLSQLASEKVTGFFNTIATIKEIGFTNATKLFDCLAGLKSLPKDGGVIGWFAGEVNYSNIASGLGSLASKGVKSFFAMTAELKQTSFDNATKLFECLAGMGGLSSGEGFFERLKDGLFGDDGSILSQIAKDLGTFAEKAGPFFKQINTLKIGNLNSLIKGLKNLSSASSGLKSKVVSEFEKIVSVIRKDCASALKIINSTTEKMKKAISSTNLSPGGVKMMNSLISGINSRKSAVIDAITSITNAVNKKINSTISGGNWALKEFGSKTRLQAFSYANGTGGHKGGNAIVNDGRGAELVQMPNGNIFIPRGRNVFMPNAPRGMKVLDASNTAKLFGKGSPTFRYANGTGDIDVFSYDTGKSLASALTNKFSDFSKSSGFVLNAGKAAVSTIKNAMSGWGEKLIKEFGAAGLGDYVASAGVSQWRSTVIRALKMEGLYSEANVKRTLYQMQTESGGNPRAINLWDSNAKKGTPSKGLMQVIDPTFKTYAKPGYNKNIYDPLSNILASVRYANSRYGSLAKAYRGHGYENGVGRISLPQYTPSGSISTTSTTTMENNTYSPSFSITINGAQNERDLARKVKTWVAEAMEETFEGLARRNCTSY